MVPPIETHGDFWRRVAAAVEPLGPFWLGVAGQWAGSTKSNLFLLAGFRANLAQIGQFLRGWHMRKRSKYSAARAAVKKAVGAGGPRREAAKLQGKAPAPSPLPGESRERPPGKMPGPSSKIVPRLRSLGASGDEARAIAEGKRKPPSPAKHIASKGVNAGDKPAQPANRITGGWRGDRPERKFNGVGFPGKDWRF